MPKKVLGLLPAASGRMLGTTKSLNDRVFNIRRFLISSYPFSYNPGENILNKVEKFSKIGQYKKSLTSTFVCFLTAIAKL